jgi:SAM-dependent methyltransferase
MPQQNSEWYDEKSLRSAGARGEPPWTSPWFPIWKKAVADMGAVPAIIELGCGPGTMAEMLFDINPKQRYVGYDFSTVNIQIARGRELPRNFHFSVRDVVKEPVTVNDPTGTVVVVIETLEHIKDDIRVLDRLPIGTKVFFSVPSHEADGHVRWFKSPGAVTERYRHLFSGWAIDSMVIGAKRYFIGKGCRVAAPKPATPAPATSAPVAPEEGACTT